MWQHAEIEPSGGFAGEFPDAPKGSIWIETPFVDGGVARQWQKVEVRYGSIGGRWAYWMPEHLFQVVTGPHPEFFAVADRLFNGDAIHFIGLLARPYAGIPGECYWVLIHPRPVGSNPTSIDVLSGQRYERSKEVFDVERVSRDSPLESPVKPI